ncbi:MAG: hypothetical protein U1E65_23960 [Myxococcota bacterium]
MRAGWSLVVLAAWLSACATMEPWIRPLPGRPGRLGSSLDGVLVPVDTSGAGSWKLGILDEAGDLRWRSQILEAPALSAELATTRGPDLFVTTSSAGMEVRGIGALSGDQLFLLSLSPAIYGRVGAILSTELDTRTIGASVDERALVITRFDSASGAERERTCWPVESVTRVVAALALGRSRLIIVYASGFEAPLRMRSLELNEGTTRWDVPVPYLSTDRPLPRVLDVQASATGVTLVAVADEFDLGFWEWGSAGGFRGLNFRGITGNPINGAGLGDLDVLLIDAGAEGRFLEYRASAYWYSLGTVRIPAGVCVRDCQLGVTGHGGVVLAGSDASGGYFAWAVPPPPPIEGSLVVATGWRAWAPRFPAPWRHRPGRRSLRL